MAPNNSKMSGMGHIIAAISPLGAALSIYALFMHWVSGKLLVVGKTITAMDFPNVFWSVLIGSAAIIMVYGWAIVARDIVKKRVVITILSSATLAAAGYFLYKYGQKSSMPGVRISFHGGLLICFIGLFLCVIGSIIPLKILDGKKPGDLSTKQDKIKPGQSEIRPAQ
jgi:hypothetical protein